MPIVKVELDSQAHSDKLMSDTVFIYALNCPVTGRTRYVGKANDPFSRYEKHLDNNKSERTHKASWIRSLFKIGRSPILEVLDEVPESEWQFWECEWIRLYRALGFDLTNGTDGGDGARGTKGRTPWNKGKTCPSLQKPKSEQTRERMRISRRGDKRDFARLGHSSSSEHREKIRVAILLHWKTRKRNNHAR